MPSPTDTKSDWEAAMQPETDILDPHQPTVSKAVSPKDDPDNPPLLELDTTVDSSVKQVQEVEYYEDNDFISIDEQDDEKLQTYRMRFYSDDISNLPILQILSRFQSEYKHKTPQK